MPTFQNQVKLQYNTWIILMMDEYKLLGHFWWSCTFHLDCVPFDKIMYIFSTRIKRRFSQKMTLKVFVLPKILQIPIGNLWNAFTLQRRIWYIWIFRDYSLLKSKHLQKNHQWLPSLLPERIELAENFNKPSI